MVVKASKIRQGRWTRSQHMRCKGFSPFYKRSDMGGNFSFSFLFLPIQHLVFVLAWPAFVWETALGRANVARGLDVPAPSLSTRRPEHQLCSRVPCSGPGLMLRTILKQTVAFLLCMKFARAILDPLLSIITLTSESHCLYIIYNLMPNSGLFLAEEL